MAEGAIYAVLKQVRTVTSSVGTSSASVLEPNSNRKGCVVYNDSGDSAFLNFGSSADLSTPVKILGPKSSWVLPGPAVWCGQIAAIREAGSGPLVFIEMI